MRHQIQSDARVVFWYFPLFPPQFPGRQMGFVQTYGKEIFAVLVPVFTWALNTFFKAKAKLLLGTPHNFTFLIREPWLNAAGEKVADAQTVHTRSLVVWNAGKETATKVEIVLNWKPLAANVWPARHFEEIVHPDNRYTMRFASLAPNESVGCELLSVNVDLPALLTVRSDQCVAQETRLVPRSFVPPWKVRILQFLILLGIGTFVFLAINVIQVLVLKTPLG